MSTSTGIVISGHLFIHYYACSIQFYYLHQNFLNLQDGSALQDKDCASTLAGPSGGIFLKRKDLYCIKLDLSNAYMYYLPS